MFFNARSIVNKIFQLDALLHSQDFTFVFITETWLKPLYPDSFLVDCNLFCVLRCDRLYDKGGGVCVIFKKSLASKIARVQIDAINCPGFEIIAFDFHFSKSKFSRFLCIYLPPSKIVDSVTIKALLKVLKCVVCPELYILGDFNFSKIDWNNPNSTFVGKSFNLDSDNPSSATLRHAFVNFLYAHNLTQMVTFPTQVSGNTLDLLITSTPQNIIYVDQKQPFALTCDHNMIEFKLHQTFSLNVKTPTKRNFYRGNYDDINEFLSGVDWISIFNSTDDINTVYSRFTYIVEESIEKFVPFYRINKKPYLPKYLRNLQHLKNLLYKQTKADPSIKPLYKDLSIVYKKSISNFYLGRESTVLSSPSKKTFFGYINHKLKARSQLPPLIDNNNQLVMEPENKAELLNNQFTSVFITDDGKTPSLSYSDILTNVSEMADLDITVDMVTKAISSLKTSVSNTPDQIPALFLRKTSSSLSLPLSLLFNITLRQGRVPKIWKKAIITPIHKKGPRNTALNYRPVSLTSVICRTEELIIHDHMSSHLMEHHLISDVQHGFVKRRSSLTQHLTFLNELTANYESNIPCDIIYLDFAKAFDSVPHNKLILVLQQLKINGFILKWIEDFLRGRVQQTRVEGSLSTPSQVTSGVPQGSVLGPLLFLLFIEDLIRRLVAVDDVSVFVYADDIKLLSCHPLQLQSALHVVEDWSVNWQLRIQPTKSEFITFSRQPAAHSLDKYSINGFTIPQISSVRDLGITLSSDFKWHNYVSKIFGKSINLAYLIVKTFNSNDPYFFINLFKLYIRPNLEYNVSAWMPYHIGDIRKIESVQATFTRLVCRKLNIKYNNYEHRLSILNLDTLEIRRIKYDLILIFKILHNLLDLQFDNFFTISPTLKLYQLRRHTMHLHKPKSPGTLIRANFFSYRTINTWNQLPSDVVMSDSLVLFKLRLNRFNIASIVISKL